MIFRKRRSLYTSTAQNRCGFLDLYICKAVIKLSKVKNDSDDTLGGVERNYSANTDFP